LEGRVYQGDVNALAFAQMRMVSHRDIKPQNIFMNSQGLVKIGDFSSATKLSETAERELELVGTPNFLLRNAIVTSIPNGKIHHDSFKSDVFSLGLTFLSMAKLEPTIEPNASFVQEKVYSSVDLITYSDAVKQMLKWMLTFDETQRPDFLSIEKLLNPSPEATPELVHTQSEGPTASKQRSSAQPASYCSHEHTLLHTGE
jgi:serine/threonine protein kinase